MLNVGQDAWTDEKIKTTVTTHFVYSHLGEAAQLPFPDSAGTSGQTYAQHIVSKAKRLLLTLIDIGIPSQITRLVDEFYDDDFLPFAEDEVASLRLSRNGSTDLERLFYHQQFKYLIRVVQEGEHIRYAAVEYAPVQIIEQKSAANMTDIPELVKLPSPVDKVFIRRQIRLQERQSEIDILSEIAAAKPLAHDHLLSVYGSYTQDDYIFVLFAPTPKWSLKSFLADTPKVFEAQPKPERRKQLFTWPLCLANALAWLHAQDAHHGAVRPSRVLIDEQFQISLGHFEGNWLLGQSTPKDDLESYQYAAPEFWKRSLTAQAHGQSAGISSSRARVGVSRPQGPLRNDAASTGDSAEGSGTIRSNEEQSYTFVPAFRDNSSRLKLKVLNKATNEWAPHGRNTESRLGHRQEPNAINGRPARTLSRRFNAMSIHSSNSSEVSKDTEGPRSRFAYSIPIDTKTTMVQAWKSSVHDQAAADVFALAAVTMDIMTVVCGRSVSAFAKHRSTKNRQAGRGGGIADASFHANIIQVVSWAEALLKESDKKVKKDSTGPFRATEHILQDAIRCFEKDPNKRMKADALSIQLQEHLTRHAGISDSHCTLRVPTDSTASSETNSSRRESRVRVNDDEALSLAGATRSAKSVRTQTERTAPSSYYDTTPTLTSQASPQSSNAPVNTPSSSYNHHTSHFAEDDDEKEPVSPGIFDYYERQWKRPGKPTVRVEAEPYLPRHAPARLYRDYTDLEDDTPQPAAADSYVTPAQTSPRVPKFSTYPRVTTEPPNRQLPVPPNTGHAMSRKGTLQANTSAKRPVTPSSANVAHATQMLAQTVGGSKRGR